MFTHEKFKEYFCNFCDKSFTKEEDLKRHENSHVAIRNYICCECNKAFMDCQTLAEHRVIMENALPDTLFNVCFFSAFSFTRKTIGM